MAAIGAGGDHSHSPLPGFTRRTERLEKLAADYPAHRRSPIIVFDLRGNGGGDDISASLGQAGEAWRLERPVPALYPTGAFIPWLLWNQEVWHSIAQDRVDHPAAVASREQLRNQWPRSAAQLSVEFKSPATRTTPRCLTRAGSSS